MKVITPGQLEIVLKKQDKRFRIAANADKRLADAGVPCGLYHGDVYLGGVPSGIIPGVPTQDQKDQGIRRGWVKLIKALAQDKLINEAQAMKDIDDMAS